MDSQYQRNFIDGVEFEETCLSKGHDSHRRNINVNEGICAESKVGISARETSRDVAFLQSDVMVVSDAINDTRSADNPLVTQESNLRFYAGAPMKTPKDHNLGTLCVIDRVPGELTQNQKKSLQALSRQVMARMEWRRQLIERDFLLNRLKHAVKEVKILIGLLPICANCKVIRNETEEWLPLETYIRDRSHAEFTHGIWPSCKQENRIESPN